MRNKIFAAIALVLLASATLTGCYDKNERLKERIANQKQCESAGGIYSEEWRRGEYYDWDCRLTTEG